MCDMSIIHEWTRIQCSHDGSYSLQRNLLPTPEMRIYRYIPYFRLFPQIGWGIQSSWFLIQRNLLPSTPGMINCRSVRYVRLFPHNIGTRGYCLFKRQYQLVFIYVLQNCNTGSVVIMSCMNECMYIYFRTIASHLRNIYDIRLLLILTFLHLPNIRTFSATFNSFCLSFKHFSLHLSIYSQVLCTFCLHFSKF